MTFTAALLASQGHVRAHELELEEALSLSRPHERKSAFDHGQARGAATARPYISIATLSV